MGSGKSTKNIRCLSIGFGANTFILTQYGYKTIENIDITDKIMNKNGIFENPIKCYSEDSKSGVQQIQVAYHPHKINVGANQKFLVKSFIKSINNPKLKNFSESYWKSASELNENDHIAMLVNQKSKMPSPFKIETKNNQYTSKIGYLELADPDAFWILGYFVGDGWILDNNKKSGRPTNKIEFIVNAADEDFVISKIRKYLPVYKTKEKITYKEYQCRNAAWFSVFQHFGKYAYGKKIPEFIQEAPVLYIKAFLDGYNKADGYFDKTERNTLRTVSESLAFSTQRLFLKLGYLYGIHKNCREGTIIKFREKESVQRSIFSVSGIQQKTRNTYLIEKEFAWYPVLLNTKEEKYAQKLYILKTATNSGFVAENLIVN